MISNNTYLKYETVDSEAELRSFIEEGTILHSNNSNWKEQLEKLIAYKNENLKEYKPKGNKEGYRNIYASLIKILLPKELEQKDFNSFVSTFAQKVDKRYKKDLLWIVKYNQNGEGRYASILMFNKKVKAVAEEKQLFRTETYYQDPIKKRRCKEDNPNAVLIFKKGDPILDKDGNPIFETIYIEERKLTSAEAKEKKIVLTEDIFRYKSFNAFTNKLKRKLVSVSMKFIETLKKIKVIARVTMSHHFPSKVKKGIYQKNDFIASVNERLLEIQASFTEKQLKDKELMKSFDLMLVKLDEKISRGLATKSTINSYLSEWWIEKCTNLIN